MRGNRWGGAALGSAVALALLSRGVLAGWSERDTEVDYGTAEEMLVPEGVPLDYGYAEAFRDFGLDSPKDDIRSWATCWSFAYHDPDHNDITGWAKVQNVWIKKAWEWTGCDPPPANAQFDLSLDRFAKWHVGGDAGNWWFTSGTAEGWAKFDLAINSSPDNVADRLSSGDFHGRKTEGVDPWAISLSLSWPPAQNLAWDDRADGGDDDFEDSDEDQPARLSQNLSNQGTGLVYVEITLSFQTKAQTLVNAEWGHGHLKVEVTDFSLAPQ